MKKDNLVLTISIGDYYNTISNFTLPFLKNYADKIGADFLNITEHNGNFNTNME